MISASIGDLPVKIEALQKEFRLAMSALEPVSVSAMTPRLKQRGGAATALQDVARR
jgi:hypothetical protein